MKKATKNLNKISKNLRPSPLGGLRRKLSIEGSSQQSLSPLRKNALSNLAHGISFNII